MALALAYGVSISLALLSLSIQRIQYSFNAFKYKEEKGSTKYK